ncbi:MAG: GGDEF domain-containing protein, partial [Spirochaetota bacterium]
KAVNDLHGHEEGDRLILDVTNALRDSLRELDSICRLGGDEFLVIMPNCSADQARSYVERVEGYLADLGRREGRVYRPSLAFGVVEQAPGTGISGDDLVALADAAMYRDKKRRKAALL